MSRRPLLAFGLYVVAVIALASSLFACLEAKHAPAIVEAGCVLVRALSTDGRALEVCATAEEIAPFVGEILSERERERAPPGPDASAGAVRLASSYTEPRRRIPWRRCAVWQEDDPGRRNDGGSRSGGGATHDGGDGGGGGGSNLGRDGGSGRE